MRVHRLAALSALAVCALAWPFLAAVAQETSVGTSSSPSTSTSSGSILQPSTSDPDPAAEDPIGPSFSWQEDKIDLFQSSTPTGNGSGAQGNGRLSPASLDLDTCGCPTTFGDPTCEDVTSWSLDKTTDSGPFNSPDGELFDFTVTVTEGPTATILSGSGTMVITNSGDQSTFLTSVALSLEKVFNGGGANPSPSPGPSGQNWELLATALQNESADCEAAGIAETCYGTLSQTAGASLVLIDPDTNDVIALTGDLEIPPTLDNDGDGLRDEDPPLPADTTPKSCGKVIDNDGDGLFDEDPVAGVDNDGDGLVDEDPADGIDNDLDGSIDEDTADDDGDGLVDEDDPNDDNENGADEDGPCEDAIVIDFEFSFDITGLGLEGPGDGIVPSADDLRVDLVATFKAGGRRGGICSADTDCSGGISYEEKYVRSIQQRHRFDPPVCDEVCKKVQLVDDGAAAEDPTCVDVVNNTTYDEELMATEAGCPSDPACTTTFTVDGTVTCICDETQINHTSLEQSLEDAEGADGVVKMTLAHPGNGFGESSYFDATLTDAGEYDGTYDDWCIDTDLTISPGTTYCVEMISTYDDVNAPGFVEMPENLDLVNWIINQGYPGQSVGTAFPGTSCTGTLTYGDVQRAIWVLVDDQLTTAGLGSWSQCRVDEIVAAAEASGEGFEPTCDDKIAIILNPVGTDPNCNPGGNPTHQITIAQVTVAAIEGVCECPDGCSTTVTNTAELLCAEDQDQVEGSPATASFEVTCPGGVEPGTEPGDFCSQTQGGWGSTPAGNNPGSVLHNNFGGVYPGGLSVGDPDGVDADAVWAMLFTSAQAVTDYLPAGGTPAALTADLTDPLVSASGVFGGQVTAATINVDFDAAGIRSDGGAQPFPAGTLGTLVFADGCVAAGLAGMSVNDVLALAHCALSGQSLAACGVPAGVTISDLSDAMATVNENFVDCDTDLGCLELP